MIQRNWSMKQNKWAKLLINARFTIGGRNAGVMTKDRDSTTVKVSLINSHWSVETNQSPNESNGMLEKEIYKHLFTGEWPGSHSFLQNWNSNGYELWKWLWITIKWRRRNHPLTN